MKKKFIFFMILAVFAGTAALGLAVDRKYPWLVSYAADQFRQKPVPVEGPKHILFSFIDHFEPHDMATMDHWLEHYPRVASLHQDAQGRHPQHTNFWYNGNLGDDEKLTILRKLSRLTYEGYGEVEFHLHHWADNEETVTQKMMHAIELSQRTGAFITAEETPRTAWGFVHGRWSLDNSRGAGDCGVNNEITVLKRLGCYGDFTHPSWGKLTPRTVNRFYYVTDDPAKPKSYDYGTAMETGKPASGDLLLLQGPTVVHFDGLKPRYDGGDINHVDLPTSERIRKWIETDIHVKGRPEWVFVRIYTHGVVTEDYEAVLGAWADKMYADLARHYNDGKKYVLHYVSSRETYNIAKAAEAGKSGNPMDYRDFLIPPYVQSYFYSGTSFKTLSFSPGKARISFLAEAGTPVKVRLRGLNVVMTGDTAAPVLTPGENETIVEFTLTQKDGFAEFSFEPARRPVEARSV